MEQGYYEQTKNEIAEQIRATGQKYYECPACGVLETRESILWDCATGGNGMCMCQYGEVREFIEYREITKQEWLDKKMMAADAVVFHDSDMDGLFSAGVAFQQYPNAWFVPTKHNDTPDPRLYTGKTAIMVDMCLPPEVMRDIKEKATEFYWIDHHQTAKDSMSDLWNDTSIKGRRDTEFAACELAWQTFHPYEKMPSAIAYVGDWDTWKFKHPETKPFHEWANIVVKHPRQSILKRLIDEDEMLVASFITQGASLVTAKEHRVEKTYADGYDSVLPYADGWTARIMNSNQDISDAGNYACKQGHDVGLIWSLREGKVIVSLRSINKDVGTLAKMLGGGGHKLASGITFPTIGEFSKAFGLNIL